VKSEALVVDNTTIDKTIVYKDAVSDVVWRCVSKIRWWTDSNGRTLLKLMW